MCNYLIKPPEQMAPPPIPPLLRRALEEAWRARHPGKERLARLRKLWGGPVHLPSLGASFERLTEMVPMASAQFPNTEDEWFRYFPLAAFNAAAVHLSPRWHRFLWRTGCANALLSNWRKPLMNCAVLHDLGIGGEFRYEVRLIPTHRPVAIPFGEQSIQPRKP